MNTTAETGLPLEGVRVIEFTHMVMGPTCGMILADLGAEVIKIEPPGGDKTRNLPGLGIGFFRSFNRNKKSVVLDEVVQNMAGLTYMTGPKGRPLRAGSSVNDIMGGMFAAIGVLAALRERESTGRGKLVKSALFENTAFLVSQHMAQYAITGEAPPPMSVKKPAWGVYDIFETKDTGDGNARLFVGVVTDTQW